MAAAKANPRRPRRPRGRTASGASRPGLGWAWALLLLPLPVLALAKLGQDLDPAYLTGYAVLISALTALAYWRDKRRAEAGEWRIPEKVLHGLELAGGWPVAIGMQQVLRHKCSKLGYQVQFWGIVALHQFVALDFLKNWQLTETAVHRLLP